MIPLLNAGDPPPHFTTGKAVAIGAALIAALGLLAYLEQRPVKRWRKRSALRR